MPKSGRCSITWNNTLPTYEIVLVNQPADPSIASRMEGLLQEVPSIRFMELAFPVYPDVAMAAAVENAIGDFVVMFTLGVDPTDCILNLVELCRGGVDVVVGVSRQAQSLSYRLVRPWNQRLLASIGYTLPRDATDCAVSAAGWSMPSPRPAVFITSSSCASPIPVIPAPPISTVRGNCRRTRKPYEEACAKRFAYWYSIPPAPCAG